eukprot:6106932-Amphidinium_carterae.1
MFTCVLSPSAEGHGSKSAVMFQTALTRWTNYVYSSEKEEYVRTLQARLLGADLHDEKTLRAILRQAVAGLTPPRMAASTADSGGAR